MNGIMTVAAVAVGAAAAVAALGLPPAHAAAPEPGSLALEFGSLGVDEGEFAGVRDAAIGPNGSIVVYDSVLERVQVFHPNGTFAFHLPGRSIGSMDVALNGNIILGGVGIFHPNGTRLPVASVSGWAAFDDIAPDGSMVSTYGHEFHVYHPNGSHSFGFGELGRDAGEFEVAGPAVFHPNGSIFVHDAGNGRTQVFHPNGTLASIYNHAWPVFVDFGPSGEYLADQYAFYAPNGTLVDGVAGRCRIGQTGMIVCHDGGERISVYHGFKMTDALPPPDDGAGPPDPPVVVEPPPAVVVDPPPPDDGAGPPDPPVVVEPPPDSGAGPEPGSLAFEFGSLGIDDGELQFPWEVEVGPDGHIFVANGGIVNSRVQAFHPNGTFAFKLEYHDSYRSRAHDLAVGPDGRIITVGSYEYYMAFHPNGTRDYGFSSRYDTRGM